MRILITAGPTREYLDPVRFLSNASSGRIGAALAAAAKALGHHVTLVLGPCEIEPLPVDERVNVVSAADMYNSVLTRFDGCDVFIAAAAVSDYRPMHREDRKIKKSEGRIVLELERTRDILGEMSRRSRRQTLVGFCLETEDIEHRARGKLQAKNLDLVVANGPEAIGADCVDAILIRRSGAPQMLTQVTKNELAAKVLKAVGADKA
jgi:phosphopantothenoylcysteine decarboxylase/phosphopantothenate--cysteine ligase